MIGVSLRVVRLFLSSVVGLFILSIMSLFGAFHKFHKIKHSIGSFLSGAAIQLSPPDRKALNRGLNFLYLFLFFLFVPLLILFAKYSSLSPMPVTNETLYETRSIIGYAETIAVASVAIFLPLMILLWNNSQEVVSSTLEELVKLCGRCDLHDSFSTIVGRTNQNSDKCFEKRLEAAIRATVEDFVYLKDIGNELRRPFAVTVLAVIVFFVILVVGNLQWGTHTYIVSVTLKALALLLFLWLLKLLCIYLVLVQPITRHTRYVEIFDLVNISKMKEGGRHS